MEWYTLLLLLLLRLRVQDHAFAQGSTQAASVAAAHCKPQCLALLAPHTSISVRMILVQLYHCGASLLRSSLCM
jgi:hypothetical protein